MWEWLRSNVGFILNVPAIILSAYLAYAQEDVVRPISIVIAILSSAVLMVSILDKQATSQQMAELQRSHAQLQSDYSQGIRRMTPTK